jgi:hypothetical protein
MTRCMLWQHICDSQGRRQNAAPPPPPDLVSNAATPSHRTSSMGHPGVMGTASSVAHRRGPGVGVARTTGPTPAISMGVVLCRMEDVHCRSSHEKAGSREDGVGIGGGCLIVAEAR